MSEIDGKRLLESLFSDKWLKLHEAAFLCGLSRRQVKKKCDTINPVSGGPFIKHQAYGGRDGYRIRWADLQGFMREHSVGRAA